MYLLIIVLCTIICNVKCAPTNVSNSTSTVTTAIIKTREAPQVTIDYKVLKKPHHLFIGRCKPSDRVLHLENLILQNDGKSHVAADVRINVEAKVNITCVKIYDEVPDGQGGYPSFIAGGVNHNFVEFNITTDYGKGFHFFVQIFGDEIPN